MRIFVILLAFCTLSCSLGDDTEPTQSAKWNLIQITGGVAGINVTLERNVITWVFDELNGTLTVEENVQGESYGLIEGTYSYSFQNIANAEFIFIDGIEYGSINIGQTSFTIDQNITSTGTMADGFEFRFIR